MNANDTKINPEKKGGLLDKIINQGQLPTVSVEVSNDTLIHLGIMIVISGVIVVLVAGIIKSIMK